MSPLQLFLTAGLIAFMGLVILLERRFPYTPGQPFFRKGLVLDLAFYGILQSVILGWIIFGLIHWIDSVSGWSQTGLISDWPVWVQVVFFLITHDLYIYWFHRWQHRSVLLWRVHEAHHSTRQVDWIAGMRSHSLEIFINQTIEFAPIILMGAAPEVALIKGTIDGIWGVWIHSNINVKTGWLQYMINGPEMHRWHHAIEITEGGLNYATKLAVWDWMFGTAWLPEGKKPAGYGLTDEAFPDTWTGQQLYLFRPLKNPS